MHNLLLDGFPDAYEGYLIRTDYRIGIQISQALDDAELSPYERIGVTTSLLYGNGIPELPIAYSGLQWFMRGGAELLPGEETEESKGDIPYFSFDYDASRIYSGFRRAYGIELDQAPLHWFSFLALLPDLGDCAFTQVVGYRSADTAKMDSETRKAYQAMKRRFALPQPESEEESEFMTLLKQKNT